jgi:hypothetical protein
MHPLTLLIVGPSSESLLISFLFFLNGTSYFLVASARMMCAASSKKGFCCIKRLQSWYGPHFSSGMERFGW